MIEDNGIRGADRIENWINQVDLLLKLLSYNFIAQAWIETNNYIENLRCVFNVCLTKISDIYDHVLTRYKDENPPRTFKKILREIKNDHLAKYISKNEKIEELYSEKIIEVLVLFLSDKREFFIKAHNKNFTLKTCLGEFVNHGHEFYLMNDLINFLNTAQKDYSAFQKNFIFNLIHIQLKHLGINKKLEDFTIEPWYCLFFGFLIFSN